MLTKLHEYQLHLVLTQIDSALCEVAFIYTKKYLKVDRNMVYS